MDFILKLVRICCFFVNVSDHSKHKLSSTVIKTENCVLKMTLPTI